MGAETKLAVEVWSPLPPQASGIADYVSEQLETLGQLIDLTLVAEQPEEIQASICERYPVVKPEASNPRTLRLYHVGNSPLHRFIYEEAVRIPGVVVLHEWNLHELLLGMAVTSNDFTAYRAQMRREHGERGSIAAETIASALGGKHWTSVFALNAELLERALGVVSLSGSTAAKVEGRRPGALQLHLPHHASLISHAHTRSEARARLGFSEHERIVLAPGLGTSAKALDVARAAIDAIRPRVDGIRLVTVGGGAEGGQASDESDLGRVDLETLGDGLLAADVVLALRFPSRGEASGVLMRTLAAGRAAIVSSGSTADEDLPAGVVGRVHPGPTEALELAALLEFLLTNEEARTRVEALAAAEARRRPVHDLTEMLAGFLITVSRERAAIETATREREAREAPVPLRFRDEMDSVAASLGLAQLPSNVFEKLSGLL
ncbi:MAG: glycosyltransferase [Vicinamibacteria bacterium]